MPGWAELLGMRLNVLPWLLSSVTPPGWVELTCALCTGLYQRPESNKEASRRPQFADLDFPLFSPCYVEALGHYQTRCLLKLFSLRCTQELITSTMVWGALPAAVLFSRLEDSGFWPECPWNQDLMLEETVKQSLVGATHERFTNASGLFLSAWLFNIPLR